MTGVDVLTDRRGEGRRDVTAWIPPDVACVAGHFPGQPIVPGFVQVGWALDAARALVGDAPPRRIEALKFKDILRPGRAIDIHVELSGGSVRFSIADSDSVVSSGRIVFRDEAEESP